MPQQSISPSWSSVVEEKLVSMISHNDLARKIYKEVISQLRMEGIPPDYLEQIFTQSTIRLEDEVVDRFRHPAERLSYHRYRDIFITEKRIFDGVTFYHQYDSLIHAVADTFQIDPFLLVSIVGVESMYGENSQNYSVFNALHTIIHRIPRKESWVEREMKEFIIFCYRNRIPPLTIYGSYAGAFGFGQFIPSSFNRYAIDFDHNGIKNPFEWSDVLASVANYLMNHGYEANNKDFSRGSNNWEAILAYNPSSKYVRVVLELRDEIKEAIINLNHDQ